jgi:broad specificity phosphatase PhoE
MKMVELWLVRHGQTEWNRIGKIQGWKDVPLNMQGRAQAEQLALALEGIQFDRIVSSDLRRARETASVLADSRSMPVEVCSWLRERYLGSAEGHFRDDILSRFGDGIPDAETDAEMADRLRRFLHHAARQWDGERVLCVTHGGAIRMLLRITEGLDVSWIDNTGITRIRGNTDGWKVLSVNERPHTAHETSDPRNATASAD